MTGLLAVREELITLRQGAGGRAMRLLIEECLAAGFPAAPAAAVGLSAMDDGAAFRIGDQWLVLTRWRDEDAFQAWVESPSFAEGHRSAVERAGGDAPKPVSTHSEVWSYEIAGGSQPG